MFRDVIFYGEELLAPRPTPQMEDHPMSAVRDCLFNVFAATLHIWKPFLHPQPEDAPYRGDRDRLMIFKKWEWGGGGGEGLVWRGMGTGGGLLWMR
jgi:hypothetical protein